MEAKDTRALLVALLADSGADWKEEAGWIRFRLQKEGAVWEMACRCEAGQALCYGRWPFEAADRARALERCSEINSQLTQGAVFLPKDGRPVFRTRADLKDPYGARRRLIEAIETNAAAIARYWGRLCGK